MKDQHTFTSFYLFPVLPNFFAYIIFHFVRVYTIHILFLAIIYLLICLHFSIYSLSFV